MKRNRIYYYKTLALVLICWGVNNFATAQDTWDRVINLEGKWKFSIGDKAIWAQTYFNDLNWEEIYVPSKWEDEGFNGYDGYAWYRKTFSGAELKNKNLSFNLILGYIDDVDQVYFNGQPIGSSGSFPPRYRTAYNALRNYFIPNELINYSGNNVIAVRVYDAEIEGGIVSGNTGIYTNRTDAALTINLRGTWNFKLTRARYDRPADFTENVIVPLGESETADGWTNIMVPDAWENQGYPDYDGAAWYRKKFTIPKELANDDLVLLLGKIDDTDRAFLNGKQIGTTNYQFDKNRYYYLQAGRFKAGQTNTLIVYVDDPHGIGGIYEGPVGIMKQSEFTRYIRWK